jgi:hypothetical protein
MGFNKRWVTLDRSINALKDNKLNQYYGDSDALIFEDNISSFIYDLFSQGLSDEQILIKINQI